jgi:hypothetical protein
MPRQSPNPLQKLVRGVLRDLIDQVNSQNADKTPKRKAKKSTTN